jgi:hypothetical protein
LLFEVFLVFQQTPYVPADNNGSERVLVLRDAKVKMKVFGQFKNNENA